MVMLKLEDQPPLIQAIFSGEIEDVRNLLDGKPDVNCQDIEKRSPLHAAAFKGDRELAELLLEQGARVNTKDSKWLTPLHRACGVGSEDTVALLLKHNADTTARDRQWQTPLHIAAANNAVECVAHLLNHVPNVNVTDRSGRTALHHAALNGHNDVVDLLISKGCIVNACDKKDCRPIHWAAHLGHVDTAELLIRNGADINVKDRNQYTPLHVAAASGMVYACRLLLNAGAEVDSQNSFGNTPLHIACLNGHLPVSHELLLSHANLEAVNYRGQTPLHIAAASTHGVECLNFLLEHNVDLNKQSLDGRTALHMSAIHGRFTRSKTLIDKGAIIDSQDKNGNTALHIAAQYGHDILTATLLSYGADANKRGYEGRTPLHVCCLSGFVEVCRKFIQASIDLNMQDDTGKTATHCAAYKGSVECLDLMVSKGADFKLQDKIGRTALHYAAARGHYNCVFTLVGIRAPVNVLDVDGCTPLHLAADYDVEGKCVEYLLLHKADPKLKDAKGYTPVHYAVNGSNVRALEFLLQSVGKGYALNGPEMPSNTPLHLAARTGNLNILRAIIPYFPDTNIKNENGCTPLLIAAREGHTTSVQMLLRYGAKVVICEDVYSMSPVHFSAKNGHMHCLAMLVDNTEDTTVIDKPDRFNRTALMLAVSGSHRDCVLTLLKSNSDPNIVDADKHSSLFRAVVTDQNNVAQLLISKKAAVNEPDVNGKTVLHLAAACGNFACLQTIVNHMKPEEAASLDNHQFTALHWASYHGNATCVEYLLQRKIFKTIEGNPFSPMHCAAFAGSERCLELLYNNFGADVVKLRDARNRSPLHIAALHGHTDCARYLLEQGTEIDSKDETGRTSLVAAAQNGQSQMIELLIAYKSDVKSCDNNGNTALHQACLKKHNHTALLLLEYINDVDIINMTNNEKKTPLHLSARNGLVDVTRNLIKKGCSVLAVDSDGLTPALCCAPNNQVAQCLAIILANHPIQYPINNHTKEQESFLKKLFKRFKDKELKQLRSSIIQTDISLVRDPRELFEDFLQKVRPEMTKKTHRRPTPPPIHHLQIQHQQQSQSVFTSTIYTKAPVQKRDSVYDMNKSKNVLLIENYERDETFSVKKSNETGLGLHRSYSEIALVPNESKGDVVMEENEKSTVNKLITSYKNVAKKMEALTKMYDVTYEDINQVYMNQRNEEPSSSTSPLKPEVTNRSLLSNRHVEFYNDVFKKVLGDKTKPPFATEKELDKSGACQGDFVETVTEPHRHKKKSPFLGISGTVARVRRKRCGCQYVCARCVTKNMYDEVDEEDEIDETTFHDCIENDAIWNCSDTKDASIGSDEPVDEKGTKEISDDEYPEKIPKDHKQPIEYAVNEPHQDTSLGAISKRRSPAMMEKIEKFEKLERNERGERNESSNEEQEEIWPKVTVDSERVKMPQVIEEIDAKEDESTRKLHESAFKEPTRKVQKESTIEVHESAIEVHESATEVKESAIEVREPAIDVKESAIEVKKSVIEVEESANEVKESPTEVQESPIEVQEAAIEVCCGNERKNDVDGDTFPECNGRIEDIDELIVQHSNSHESYLQYNFQLSDLLSEAHSQNSSDNEYY